MSNIVLYSHNHQKGYWEYHLQWCPKYRHPVFADKAVREDCEQILREAAAVKGVKLAELAVMPDHVHTIAVTDKPIALSELEFYLKGRSSYELLKKHPELRKQYWGKHFWSRSTFTRTVGLDADKARRYVRHQHDVHQRRLWDYN
jgi:putative transposase